MKLLKLLMVFYLVLLVTGCATSSQYAWRATWKDEFRGIGSPNKQMWERSVTSSGTSGQLSGYRDEDGNAYINNGKLHLRIYKTNDGVPPYKAGRLFTRKEFRFKKGKLVVRAKAPTTPGLWPAIWLNGPQTKNGYFVELDLMEHVHAMGDSSYTAVYHLWGEFRGKKGNHVSYGHDVAVDVGKWHVYKLEVLDDVIRMSVDGKEVYVIRKGEYGDEWPEDQEYILYLALAYGGFGATETGIDDTALPAEMLVDYVRFYELKESKK